MQTEREQRLEEALIEIIAITTQTHDRPFTGLSRIDGIARSAVWKYSHRPEVPVRRSSDLDINGDCRITADTSPQT